nr:terminase gpA endonuclease subunit [Pseudogemmobacter bohemicus]
MAKRAPETLQTFTNLILGEPWRTQGDEIDDATLRGRAEAFSLDALPPEVLLITVGVDCQDDRLEAVTLGHTKDGSVFTLDHRVFWGRIETDTPWSELDDHLKMRWQHSGGGTIGVDAAAVDEGSGGHVEIVRAFCRPRFARRVVNVKGVPGFARPFMERSSSKTTLLFIARCLYEVIDRLAARIFPAAHLIISLASGLVGRDLPELLKRPADCETRLHHPAQKRVAYYLVRNARGHNRNRLHPRNRSTNGRAAT